MFNNKNKITNEKHIAKGDIIGIFISFGLAIFTLSFPYGYFGFYYLLASLFRLIMVILQNLSIRKKDDPVQKFKKERRLCRFAGILFLILNSFASLGFIGSINKDPSEIFLKIPWLILIYAIYAIYRFISGYLLLDKARRSWSPYREIFANLSYFEGIITLFNVEIQSWESLVIFLLIGN